MQNGFIIRGARLFQSLIMSLGHIYALFQWLREQSSLLTPLRLNLYKTPDNAK